jgi:hypothetical protein
MDGWGEQNAETETHHSAATAPQNTEKRFDIGIAKDILH